MANAGSLTLEHDVTPTDITQLGVLEGTKPPSDQHYRYQGFPDGHFAEVRKPITGFVDYNQQPFENFRKGQHFVKGLPPGQRAEIPTHAAELSETRESKEYARQPAERTTNGIQYGSDSLPVSRSAPPQQKAVLRDDRTSAEERKRARQKLEADLAIAEARQRREKTYKEIQEEKKKDLQMLKNYKPWGRPGGGAPPNSQHDVRRTKTLEDSVLGNKGELLLQFPVFGKQGHGAPLRTDSGTIKASFRASHDIRFQEGVKDMPLNVHNKIRYAQPRQKGDEYMNELGNMLLEQRTRREIEKQKDLEEEKKTWKYDPFGKSGGGAPIKTDSGKALAGRQRTLVKNSYELREVEQKQERKKRLSEGEPGQPQTDADVYNPWGKGSGAPDRDEDGNVRRFKWTDGHTVPVFIDPDVKGISLETRPVGGGGHRVDGKGEKLTRIPQTLVHDQNTGGPLRDPHRHPERMACDPSQQEPDAYNPWGRPGNGAPILDQEGNIFVTNRGKAEFDKMGFSPPNTEETKAKKDYLEELKKEIDKHHHLHDEEIRERRKPATEVATWIRNKEVGYPKRDPVTRAILPIHYKQTSDVTAQRMDIRRPAGNQLEYQSELERQAQDRYHANLAKKQKSRDLSVYHQQNFDQMWGRPGNGAPGDKTDHKRLFVDAEKVKQADLSFQPPWTQPHVPHVVRKPWARTTALENRFKSESQQNLLRVEYHVRPPWGSI